MVRKILLSLCFVAVAAAVLASAYVVVSWKWCPFGSSLQMTRKTGATAGSGQYAQRGQQGVSETLLGPGRHFVNPWTYAVKKIDDIHIHPGQIATVKSNVGADLPADRFIAEPGEKGTQRRVLTPGVWRINTFGEEAIVQDATTIKPGYVGVQTVLGGGDKGIKSEVLQAGYYNINPVEVKVLPIEIGYRVWDVKTEAYQKRVVENGVARMVQAIKPGSGVSFPLADGKEMYLDFTVVWGIFPENAPRIIGEYGNVAEVEQKIIEPQVLSICKNAGSNLTTQEFIEGETREKFQNDVTEALQAMGREKGIHFLIALVRSFHPAEDIKATIQARMLAEEEKITLKIEQSRDVVAADLEQADRRVEVAVKDFDGETEALVQEEMEQGNKQAAEIEAQADREVADLQRQAAEIQAQVVKILGQAEADVIEATKKAEAIRLQLLIDAYGGAESYNLATFADLLPEELRVEYRYAGEGTFWTDTADSMIEKAARKMLGGEQGTIAP